MLNSDRFYVSRSTLILLAACVWYSGVIILVLKSYQLFNAAHLIQSGKPFVWVSIIAAVLIGLIKARYMFVPVCKKNIIRIRHLVNPKLWDFYRFRFYVFLATMVSLGMYFSVRVQGDYLGLILLGIIDRKSVV